MQYVLVVYETRGYWEVVARIAEKSMQKTVEEVNLLPAYTTEGKAEAEEATFKRGAPHQNKQQV